MKMKIDKQVNRGLSKANFDQYLAIEREIESTDLPTLY